ncbi:MULTISPECIES: hypothetical protein [Atopobiaceae]|uniref:Uncharacterized protein n=1 Tax=Parafannyhessea umbonata TaxID=604330 RepID=A0A1H9P213_9ACTN|nr:MULTISPECIES: hypothetical protein [Atopobiaceae]SEH41952.1 hypothetical protein SAMN05216447_10253 [Parafannyhessea umbonata]SER42230.1 hypothetical protein SAMN05216446_0766 [Parafannyhessea umbonata]SJZ55731.1 hypothetical protein SAMN06298223_0714 [Olsenella sp. KH1P3]
MPAPHSVSKRATRAPWLYRAALLVLALWLASGLAFVVAAFSH